MYIVKKNINGKAISPNIRLSLSVEYLKETSEITIIKNTTINKNNL